MASQQKLLIEELFLVACSPILMEIIEKRGKEFCEGCQNNSPGPHAHACAEDVYREKLYKMKNKALPYMVGRHRDVLQKMFTVYQANEKFQRLHAGELLYFFGNSSTLDPLVKLQYETEWWWFLEDLMTKMKKLEDLMTEDLTTKMKKLEDLMTKMIE